MTVCLLEPKSPSAADKTDLWNSEIQTRANKAQNTNHHLLGNKMKARRIIKATGAPNDMTGQNWHMTFQPGQQKRCKMRLCQNTQNWSVLSCARLKTWEQNGCHENTIRLYVFTKIGKKVTYRVNTAKITSLKVGLVSQPQLHLCECSTWHKVTTTVSKSN